MTLNKSDMIKSIEQELECTLDESAEMINSVIDCIRRSLENGDDVMISGFGKFCVKNVGSRKIKNPATGEDMVLPPRKVIKFKCSDKLKEKVNDKD